MFIQLLTFITFQLETFQDNTYSCINNNMLLGYSKESAQRVSCHFVDIERDTTSELYHDSFLSYLTTYEAF